MLAYLIMCHTVLARNLCARITSLIVLTASTARFAYLLLSTLTYLHLINCTKEINFIHTLLINIKLLINEPTFFIIMLNSFSPLSLLPPLLNYIIFATKYEASYKTSIKLNNFINSAIFSV